MRYAVVTGGARGIGGAITRRLAADGAEVLVVDVDAEAADVTAAEVGNACTVLVGEVTDDETVTRVAAAVHERGRLDVLVNNVGDFRPASRTFLHSTREQRRRLHDLNLGHVLEVTHALLPVMLEQGSGAIVNNATVEAFRGIPGHAAYSAFNAVAPDLADTDQPPAAAMLRGRDPASVPWWVPLGRFGRPDDYAAVVAVPASDDARFVTGQTVAVDGGTLAASGWYRRADGKGWTHLPDLP